MRTVLPPSLDQKRLLVAGAHNTVVVLCGFPLVIAFFAYLFLRGRQTVGHENDVKFLLLWYLPIALPVVIGFVALIVFLKWNDERLCREVGYVCDRCGTTLYRLGVETTGVCPSCGMKLVEAPLSLNG